MRIPLAAALVAACAVPAAAQGQEPLPFGTKAPVEAFVTANPNNTFTPREVTIRKDGTVTWTNMGGFHDVTFDDGSFQQPPQPLPIPWTVARTFPSKGTFAYYCSVHGAPGGVGMSGVVRVATNQ